MVVLQFIEHEYQVVLVTRATIHNGLLKEGSLYVYLIFICINCNAVLWLCMHW